MEERKHLLDNEQELIDFLFSAVSMFSILNEGEEDIERRAENMKDLCENIKFFAQEYKMLADEGKMEEFKPIELKDGETMEDARKELLKNLDEVLKSLNIKK